MLLVNVLCCASFALQFILMFFCCSGKQNQCIVQKAEQGWWKRLLIAEGKPPHYVKVDWDKWYAHV